MHAASLRARGALLVLVLSTVVLTACGTVAPVPTSATATATTPSTPKAEATPTSRLTRDVVPSPSPTPDACEPLPAYTAPLEVPAWPAPGPVDFALHGGLQSLLESLVPADGRASVVVVDVGMKQYASVAPDTVWYPASLYKLPLLVEALWQEEQGLLDPDRVVTIGERYAAQDLGTMEHLGLHLCSDLTVADAVTYMAAASDNATAQLVNDLVGTRNVHAHLATLGATQTSVGGTGLTTTAHDMALLLSATVGGYPSPFVGAAVQRTLLDQWVRDRIPSGITDDEASVANKTGDWTGAAHDVATIRTPRGTYVLVILTDGSLPTTFFTNMAASVHAYLNATWDVQP